MLNLTRLALIGVAFAGSVACATPKYLVGHDFIGTSNKVARYIIQPGGTVGSGDDAQAMYNYYIEVCDVEPTKTANCKSTLVLANVIL